MTEGDTPSSSGSSTPSPNPTTGRFTFQSPPPRNPTMDTTPPSTPVPTTPVPQAAAPATFTLTEDQLKALIAGKTAAVPQIEVPRVGGVNIVGAWTGKGAQELGLHPQSSLCMRQFKGSELKAYQALLSIEEKCKAGLQAKGDFVFGLPGEPNHDKGALLIRETDDLITQCGMEGVFQIVLEDGTIVDMLKEPGFVNEDMVDAWVQDLTTNGVHDGKGKGDRLPVCSYDLTNLHWSASTISNTCSALLKQELYDILPPSKHTGPQLLVALYKKVYPSSYVKIKGLITQLESLDIKKVPGENISTLVLQSSQLVREIKMNFLSRDQVPDLAISAMKAFAKSSHPFVQHVVTATMLKANKQIMTPSLNKKDRVDPLVLLQELDDTYIMLKEQGNYAPGDQTTSAEAKAKAMQAEIKKLKEDLNKLSQDRNATSTRGNANGKDKVIRDKKGDPIQCHKCGKNHYIRDCPDKDDSNEKSDKSQQNRPRSNKNGKGKQSGGNRNGGGYHGNNDNGLGAEMNKKISIAITEKLKTMPERAQIPDDAKYCITIDGKDLAKYCRHHGHFIRGMVPTTLLIASSRMTRSLLTSPRLVAIWLLPLLPSPPLHLLPLMLMEAMSPVVPPIAT